jgi:2-dehydropantoate 2-reductase
LTSTMDNKKKFKQILILGAGAIGSFYGAYLSKYYKLQLIGNKEHVESINKNGLQLKGVVEGVYKVEASSKIKEIPANSLLLITTKATDLENVLRSVKPFLKKDTVIFILQNGYGNEELGHQILGENTDFFRGITTAGVEFVSPGIIDVKQIGETILPDSKTGRKVSEVLNESKLKAILSKNMAYEIWRKLTMNCVINPLTAIFRVRNNEIADESLIGIRDSVISECRAVAAMEGVKLESGLEDEISGILPNYSNLSSMCQDILKGKRTEIEFLNGKISQLGDKYKIPTPVNDTLASLIRFMEGKDWN